MVSLSYSRWPPMCPNHRFPSPGPACSAWQAEWMRPKAAGPKQQLDERWHNLLQMLSYDISCDIKSARTYFHSGDPQRSCHNPAVKYSLGYGNFTTSQRAHATTSLQDSRLLSSVSKARLDFRFPQLPGSLPTSYASLEPFPFQVPQEDFRSRFPRLRLQAQHFPQSAAALLAAGFAEPHGFGPPLTPSPADGSGGGH